MKKKFSCLVLAALMFIAGTQTVYAEDFQKEGWYTAFTGSKIESSFTEQELAYALEDIQPGDSVEIKVDVENRSGKDADWYMSNKVLQSLEEGSPAKGGAYTYMLKWESNGTEKMLYNSENVGGEVSTDIPEVLEGLREATDSLEQFFYLDELGSGKSGQITLRVSLNGETQGNSYQNTLAKLRLNFAVEGRPEGTVKRVNRKKPGENIVYIPSEETPKSVIYSPGVKTGDPANMMLWAVIMLISGLSLLVIGVIYHRKRKEGIGHE